MLIAKSLITAEITKSKQTLRDYAYTLKERKSQGADVPTKERCDMSALLLYTRALSRWDSHPNGETSGFKNYLTVDEMNNIYFQAKYLNGIYSNG